jgi:phenol 2-monooxygenase
VQFHHHGYVSGDPRIQPAAGVGIGRPDDLPGELDVLIIGGGPAGHIAAAQLAQFPRVTTRLIEQRAGRLELGQADGIQARSVETFQAFGFATRIMEEAYRITAMAFWGPDPDEPRRIIRTGLPADDPEGVSEFPHLIVNQARIQDYFAEAMANAPARLRPDYGVEFLDLVVDEDTAQEHPVSVRVRYLTGPRAGEERAVRAKYVVGADGAKSKVRDCIGRKLVGEQAMHAWGVMDVLAVTDFPDIRTKCAIQSHDGGSILLIPREGGHLFRMYVDLGEVAEDDHGAVRQTSLDETAERANHILHPYTLEVKSVVWHSVYEVGHRLTDKFDDVLDEDVGRRAPRVFIVGDACHTHSAKAGQGMNVSMQDGFNLAWKLGHVLDARAPEALLDTYSAERQTVAKNLIEFDKEWSSLMAAKPAQLADPSTVEEFYLKTFEFPAGFMTQYAPSILTAQPVHQDLATGFPIGKRFKSATVVRVCDTNPVHLGHHARADGRWRIYVFADAAAPGDESALSDFAAWIACSPESPVVAHIPPGVDVDAWVDLKVIYQQRFDAIDLRRVPCAFLPRTGALGLTDYQKVYAAGPGPDGTGNDVFDVRGIDRGGVVVVVRPDQYVSHVLPLGATVELRTFFEPILLRQHSTECEPDTNQVAHGPCWH